ncbi:hypothetical protein DOE59_21160 [Salmonella enterica subsp. diarizonae serovar 48:i:z]|uniref:Uncharacterized protein n=1 Tax=Salmonella enterica subsp. diarizonae serovar 48:i:z TaxID=1192842 RepID=A0A7U6BG06_SALDZ|nr:hypothetical protein DOE59_21160 [Salmonella enterica subsp. diarizonae serovar 48:i:z]EAA4452011.1 hypothetical protein [Salmonella enterica subsp. diarizonae]EAM2672561.1 hypothetical protein [Salmonella enterica]EDW6116913.1 hypothetical protein [Salmonella enterica subsp. salamae]EAM6404577.1 hypothetical protein [Salmonella enterica]
MLKKTPFFKIVGSQTEILPFLIFRSIMIAVQIFCIAVLLNGAFDIVLNNIGDLREGSLGTIIRSE